MNKFRLNNKLTIIIGGFGLIGSEITNLCLKAGSKVVVLDNNKSNKYKNLKNKNKKKLYYEYFDCGNESIEINFLEIINKYGCPDIFINCSYPTTVDWKKSSFKDVTKKILDENIMIHLNSYSWLAKLVAEKMITNKIKGSIIQFSSIYGILGQDLSVYKKTKIKENMIYSIIKGGIANLTRQMSSYYGKHGIRVNTISPGGVLGHIKNSNYKQEPTFIKNYSNKVPLGRLGDAKEIAYCVIFLASDASSYITGINLMVDGGWSAI